MNIENIFNELIPFFTSIAGKIIGAIFALIIGKIVIKIVMKLLNKSRFIAKTEPTVASFLISFVNIALNILIIITVIGILGVPMASVVTVIASAGVAVGLALQGALSNLAGGIMIIIFKPFKIGDFVEITGNSGTVKGIGIFYTVIDTPDNKQITVPNGAVMASAITNYSVHDTRRLDFTFSVAYGTSVDKVSDILLEEAKKHALVLSSPEPFARLAKQNSSSLDFVLRVWTKSDDYWTVNFDLLEAVNKRFETEGIEIPFNQLDVHIDNK